MTDAPLERVVARCESCDEEFTFREAVGHMKWHPEKHEIVLIER